MPDLLSVWQLEGRNFRIKVEELDLAHLAKLADHVLRVVFGYCQLVKLHEFGSVKQRVSTECLWNKDALT